MRVGVASLALLLVSSVPVARAAEPGLRIYFIDVEGGQSTLVVDPDGETLLVDAGNPGNGGRDLERIQAAMRDAQVDRIDTLVITHYHSDHVGGVPALLKKVPVRMIVEHGVNREDDAGVKAGYEAFLKAAKGHKVKVVRPGDKLAFRGMSVTVVTADGERIGEPLAGAGEVNPPCEVEPQWAVDATENARSVGMLLEYGEFRFADFGDLTKAKEVALVCPKDLVGKVNLYLTTHHGLAQSNSAAMLEALRPEAAIMNNGPHKGGEPVAWQTVLDQVGAGKLWQLHTAEAADARNVPETQIANLPGTDAANRIDVVAFRDGSFTVTNRRNGVSQRYAATRRGE